MSHWIELVPMGTASFGNGWEGRVVEGRFPLLKRLGGSENCGSFLTVLQGLQEAVIQLIMPDGTEADTYIAQWEVARGLSHPHLAKMFAEGRCVIDHNDLVYVVTERPYSTLSNIIQIRTLKADSARESFSPVLDALSYLHKNGVVHGYINPSNIQFSDMKPKLSITDLLIVGSVKRSFSGSGNYDAPELTHGNVTAAADAWSVGMCLYEAMTESLPSWDRSQNAEPEVTKFLPSPFREIVQDCLRIDPLRRCTIESILERLDESKSIPTPDAQIPVKIENPIPTAAPIATGETPIRDKPDALPPRAKKIETEELPEPVLFSKSLTHFEETPLSRFRILPYVVVLLAVVALVAVLLGRGHMSRILSAVTSQNAPAVSPPAPEKQSAAPVPSVAPAPSVANQTGPESSPPATKTQPDATPQAETPSAPSQEQPVPPPVQPPASAPDHALVKENTEGLAAKRVLPVVSPGARAGMRRPVEVVIRVSVNREGAVSDAAYVSPGPGNYFARLAQRTARSWEFKPPIRNGEPQRSVWTLRFNFEREKTEVTATEAEN
jgi:protein TonB